MELYCVPRHLVNRVYLENVYMLVIQKHTDIPQVNIYSPHLLPPVFRSGQGSVAFKSRWNFIFGPTLDADSKELR